jgi:hypothetical protein
MGPVSLAVPPGRSGRIRTCDIQLPKLALYQAELHSGPETGVVAVRYTNDSATARRVPIYYASKA